MRGGALFWASSKNTKIISVSQPGLLHTPWKEVGKEQGRISSALQRTVSHMAC